jgi:hypothetical protein
MMSGRGVRLAILIAVAVCAVGCASASPDSDPGGGAEPETTEQADPDVDDGSSASESPADDDLQPAVFQGQLYPPLPDDLRPDPAAGEVEAQQEVLDLFPDFVDAIETTFATNEIDPRLEALVDADYLGSVREELGFQIADDVVSVSPDGEFGWLEVVAADADEVAIDTCVEHGPQTGLYDASSGELVLELGDSAFLRTHIFAADPDAPLTWQAVSVSAQSQDDVTCQDVRA